MLSLLLSSVSHFFHWIPLTSSDCSAVAWRSLLPIFVCYLKKASIDRRAANGWCPYSCSNICIHLSLLLFQACAPAAMIADIIIKCSSTIKFSQPSFKILLYRWPDLGSPSNHICARSTISADSNRGSWNYTPCSRYCEIGRKQSQKHFFG